MLTDRVYTKEAQETAKKVAKEVDARHARWVVGHKFILDQTQVDGALSLQGRFCDEFIFNEEERINRNQRILLRCEQDKVQARKQAAEDKQATLRKAVGDVNNVAERLLIGKLESTPIEKLCGGIPEFDQLASFAYSPSLSFSKLSSLTTLNHRLNSTVLDLVANSEFGERLGPKAKNVTDAKVAIGLIGIENSRMLFPVLMARPMLRWSDNYTKLIVPKLWQHLVVTANATRMRLQDSDVKEPDVGVLIGVLRILGTMVIVNHYSLTFQDALVETMISYREQDQRDAYYACADIEPNPAFLPNVIYKMEGEVTKKILEYFDWPKNGLHIKQAVLEDIERKPILERSVYGAALGQARAYSMFDGLNRSQMFVEKHKPFLFANVQISGAALQDLRERMPGKMTLSMFLGG